MSFSIIIVLTCVITGYALYSMRQAQLVAMDVNEILENRYRRLEQSIYYINDFQNKLYNYIISDTISEAERAKDGVDNSAAQMVTLVNNLDTAHFSNEVDLVRDMVKKLTTSYTGSIVPLVQQGQVREGVGIYSDQLLPLFNSCFERITTIRQNLINSVIKEVNEAADISPMLMVSIAALAAISLGLTIAFITAGYLKKALLIFGNSINQLAERDFSHKIQVPYADEFGTLASSLEHLRSNQALLLRELAEMSEHISAQMHTANQTLNRLSHNATESENRIISVAASANEMVATTQDIAQNCNIATNLANQSTEITNDGMEKAKASIHAIYEQSEQTKANNKQIEAMIKQSHSINSIVNTIDEIAAQTNLLALNAAIEAARAGEAGRGFAVVADEVRALASRTSSSTSEISQKVAHMEKDANNATDSMSKAVHGMSTLADNTSVLEHVLTDILDQVRNVNAQISQIATAAEEQTTATNEISSNMQDLTESAREVASIANETLNMIDSTTNAIEQFAQTMKSFRF